MYGLKCGRLLRHLYGTRGAAVGWEDEYAATMGALEFTRGTASGCRFMHKKRQLRCAVYGDDFTTVGAKRDVDWFERQLQQYYAITLRGRLGPGPEDCKEATLLNRVVRWVDGVGIELETDPRQGERMISQLGLEGASPISCRGMKITQTDIEGDAPIVDERVGIYRAVTARSNFMTNDRPKTQFATKETCRNMAAPTEEAYKALNRIGRFIVGKPRLVIKFPFHNFEHIDVFCDSDWAGCLRTRKNTIGGCVLLGAHLVKTWSTTRTTISFSNGEAEHYAVVKTVGVGLGIQGYLRDLGVHLELCVHTDSSAAVGIAKRVGLGTQRHLAVRTLWIQSKLRSKAFELFKVRGEANPADLFTKHLNADKMNVCLSFMGAEYREGRPTTAPRRK